MPWRLTPLTRYDFSIVGVELKDWLEVEQLNHFLINKTPCYEKKVHVFKIRSKENG